MMSLNFEYFLGNLSFSCLLIMVIYYWAQLNFFVNRKFSDFGFFGIGIANLALFLFLSLRWLKSGHFPLSNLYESLLFLSWSFTTFHLVLEKKIKNPFIGVVTTPMALFTNAFATFSLPIEMQKATVLVPALQSNWLMMHVTIMIISYAALMSGSLLAIAFLVINYKDLQKDKNKKLTQTTNLLDQKIKEKATLLNSQFTPTRDNYQSNLQTTSLLFSQNKSYFFDEAASIAKNQKIQKPSAKENFSSPLAETLDNLSYRTLGLGFPLLTIGILSGAVWANEAWGSYWNWDPKETWAFITWLVFAIYLHTRLTKNWTGKKPAIIATIGFLIVWICYLGVNLLGTGLHSYGWFKN